MKLIGAQYPPQEIERIDKVAEHFGVPRSTIIRWAISKYVDHFFLIECPPKSTKDYNEVQVSPVPMTTDAA